MRWWKRNVKKCDESLETLEKKCVAVGKHWLRENVNSWWNNKKNVDKKTKFIRMKCEKYYEQSRVLEKSEFLSNNSVFEKMWRIFEILKKYW